MAKDLWRLGAVETAALIRNGEASSGDVTQAHLARLAEVNPGLNAVVNDMSVAAQAAAEQADAAQAAGAPLGALHGVPVTTKENADQAGYSTPNGIPALDTVIAEESAPAIANLEAAGAITIGRTNTPEFSFRWFSDNPLHGMTLNPWQAERTPGGSSGGAASALAMGVGCIAHGSDLGGSLRYPAYCCGLATIRPSLGRIAAFNRSGAEERPPIIEAMAAQGPIGRSVADVRLGLEVMAAPDWRDPAHIPMPLQGPAPDGPLRVAVTSNPIGTGVDAAVATAVDTAAGYLSDAGYVVERAEPPRAAEIAEAWRNLIGTEAQVLMAAAAEAHGSDDFKQVFKDCFAATPPLDIEGYLRAVALRARYRRQWAGFQQAYPLVLMPVSAELPFLQGEDLKGPARVGEMLDTQAPMYVVNYLGLPSAGVPTGLHGDLPLGVQIVGRPFREDLCLDAAQAIEDRVGILSEQLWARSG